jgi:hypothetical protein
MPTAPTTATRSGDLVAPTTAPAPGPSVRVIRAGELTPAQVGSLVIFRSNVTQSR